VNEEEEDFDPYHFFISFVSGLILLRAIFWKA